MTDSTHPTFAARSLVAGKYEVLHLIGRGGMGSVWEGRHESLGTRVAIKFVDAEHAQNEEARSRFVTEARAAASIQSKHAIQIYDHGVTEDGRPYIVMELLVGEPLDHRIDKRGRLSLGETARTLSQVCRAVARAHGAGIIHRDLKPENIFLVRSSEDDDEIAKVLDFGIAKIKAPPGETWPTSSTKTGAVLGTPYYMSPEQARGLRDVDHRTDLWSLGVIAYKCLTGALPFEGQSMGDLLVNICTGPIPTPSHVAPDLPPSFDGWFSRALDRNPDRRFQDARELSEALALCAGLGSLRLPSNSAERDASASFRLAPSATASAPVADAAITSTPFTAQATPARSSRTVIAWVLAAAVLGGVVGLAAMVKLASSSRSVSADEVAAPRASADLVSAIAMPAASAAEPAMPEASPPPVTSPRAASEVRSSPSVAASWPVSKTAAVVDAGHAAAPERAPIHPAPKPGSPASVPSPAAAAQSRSAPADPGY